MNAEKTPNRPLAGYLTNALNPFFIFTALYAAVAFTESPVLEALLYIALEALAAGLVIAYVLLMRRRRRVGGFWIPARAERIVPAIFLLSAFAGLLTVLFLLDAPETLFQITLSMGLAAVVAAGITLLWKISAHAAVAGHAALAGALLLGLWGLIFVIALPLVIWARVTAGAHTFLQALAGAGVGALLAFAFLA